MSEKREGLFAKYSRKLKERNEEMRKQHPYMFVTPTDNIIFVENVANMLGCGIDHVRRIPKLELPTSKTGRRLNYLREDVENYV